MQTYICCYAIWKSYGMEKTYIPKDKCVDKEVG